MPPIEDIDFTSDLNNGDVSSHGADAVSVNDTVAPRTGETPQKVAKADTPDDKAAKPLSIRDHISSALKGESAETPPAGRPRNADGTFAPAQAVEPVATGADPANPVIDPAAPPAVAPVAVPAGLVGITPETFAALPAETQGHLARTMEQFTQAHEHFSRLDQIEQLIAPRRQAWALNGMTEAQALNQLLALSDFATRDAQGFIKYMADQSGVSLEDMVFAAPKVDPTIAALQKEINDLKSGRTQDQQLQQRTAHENTVRSVQAFASEKGQDGQPLRPHFEELGQGILPYISAVKAQNPTWPQGQILQQAYENACWATPTVRAKMQAATQAAADAERLRAETARVDKARAASVGVPSRAPGSPSPNPTEGKMSLRDTIRAAMASTS